MVARAFTAGFATWETEVHMHHAIVLRNNVAVKKYLYHRFLQLYLNVHTTILTGSH
jgi:hypothetical protein